MTTGEKVAVIVIVLAVIGGFGYGYRRKKPAPGQNLNIPPVPLLTPQGVKATAETDAVNDAQTLAAGEIGILLAKQAKAAGV